MQIEAGWCSAHPCNGWIFITYTSLSGENDLEHGEAGEAIGRAQ